MRPIKFRAFNKETGYMMNPWGLAKSDDSDAFDLVDDSMAGEIHACDYNTTDCVVLMQYTGLHDKNGKEIYEGDIVKTPHYQDGRKRIPAEVRFVDGEFIADCTDMEFALRISDPEVIGTIYEDAHLLEGDE